MSALEDLQREVGETKASADRIVTVVGAQSTKIDELNATVQALRDQIAQGGTVTDADLAALSSSLNDVQTELDGVVPPVVGEGADTVRGTGSVT